MKKMDFAVLIIGLAFAIFGILTVITSLMKR